MGQCRINELLTEAMGRKKKRVFVAGESFNAEEEGSGFQPASLHIGGLVIRPPNAGVGGGRCRVDTRAGVRAQDTSDTTVSDSEWDTEDEADAQV